MNSERIRQEFGNFGIDVIECSTERRVASLYSVESGARVCRTWAEVAFNASSLPDLAAEHALVLAGQSIGAVFKRHGWVITKRHARIASVTLTAEDAVILSHMGLEAPQPVALHSYIFEVAKGGAVYDYATITERHHPRYLTAPALEAIYCAPACPRSPRAARQA